VGVPVMPFYTSSLGGNETLDCQWLDKTKVVTRLT
jgi:hypothetical protein